jgi:hypothetical protein
MIVIGLVTLVICGFLWTLLDVGVTNITSTATWQNASGHAATGQQRIAQIWLYSPVFIVTATGFTLLLSARRGA